MIPYVAMWVLLLALLPYGLKLRRSMLLRAAQRVKGGAFRHRKKINSKAELESIKRDQRRQRLIRWAELLEQFDDLIELVDGAITEALIDDEHASDAWELLQKSRLAVFSSGIPK